MAAVNIVEGFTPPVYPQHNRLVYYSKRGDRYTQDITVHSKFDKMDLYGMYTNLIEMEGVTRIQYLKLKGDDYKSINLSNVLIAIIDSRLGKNSRDFMQSVAELLENTMHKVVV